MQTFKEFLIFLFWRQRRIVYIRGLRKKTAEEPAMAKMPTETMLRHRIILVVTYVISAALLISLTGIIALLILSPNQDVPIILHDIFFGTLGYFGGAFANFLKVDYDRK